MRQSETGLCHAASAHPSGRTGLASKPPDRKRRQSGGSGLPDVTERAEPKPRACPSNPPKMCSRIVPGHTRNRSRVGRNPSPPTRQGQRSVGVALRLGKSGNRISRGTIRKPKTENLLRSTLTYPDAQVEQHEQHSRNNKTVQYEMSVSMGHSIDVRRVSGLGWTAVVVTVTTPEQFCKNPQKKT